jgi:thiol-disulfide isomerase/thioredoxin
LNACFRKPLPPAVRRVGALFARFELLALFALFALLAFPKVQAAPAGVEAFDARTWQALRQAVKRPTVVVFSATWCPNCPAVIEDLAQDIRDRHLQAPLLAVVMDVAPGESDAGLLRHAHYALTDRLFAFSGQAPALRLTVDPSWRGATPFVAFLAPGKPPRFVTGPPSDADLQAWLAPAVRKPR